jgi:pimeloyl-ACP methyl ester carboxylesterase
MGGKVGMLLAARHPRRVRSLAVVDGTPNISTDGLAELRRIGARGPRRFPSRHAAASAFRLIPPETVARPARLRALADRSARHRGHGRWSIGPDREFFTQVTPEVAWPLLPRIACPTLILRAERSSILDRRTAQAMRRAIPRSTLCETRDTYHHLILERPDEVARLIREFLLGRKPEKRRSATGR